MTENLCVCLKGLGVVCGDLILSTALTCGKPVREAWHNAPQGPNPVVLLQLLSVWAPMTES